MRAVWILLALIYLLSPVDLVPEALFGPFGLIDDLAVLFAAVKQLGAKKS